MSLVHQKQMNGHGDLKIAQSPNSSTQIIPHQGTFDEVEISREYNAPPSSFSIPKQNDGGMQDRGAGGLADFFSAEVFQIVLHNPTTAHRLHKFSQARMCGENMEFLEKVSSSPQSHARDLAVDLVPLIR